MSEKKWHLSLPPPPFASSRSCRRQGGCQQLLYGADPSTHSISPHFLLLLTSLPLQSGSFTSLLLLHDPLCVASSIFPFSSHVGCNPTLLLFMELPQLFPLQQRPNLSNKSFNLQISTTGKDQQPGRGNLRSRKCWTKGKRDWSWIRRQFPHSLPEDDSFSDKANKIENSK